MPFATIDPATGKILRTFQAIPDSMAQQKISRAAEAFRTYKRTSFAERSHWSITLAEILERDKRELGQLMTLEMGKTLASAIQEAEKCAWLCRHFAANAERYLSDENIQTYASLSFLHYEPLGAILAIMPWNFPFWQVLRFGIPAVLAGNVVLLKHAPSVPQCALKIEAIFLDAGFPPGVFQNLFVEVDQIPSILGNPHVKAASLTGSTEAGKRVAALAGSFAKKCVLELGGSDPFIVMPSADVAEAASVGVTARIINNGQSCIAAKRFIIHAEVYDEFVDRFVDRMKQLRVGNPMEAGTDIGPIARADLRDKLHEQVQKSAKMGARILLGGKKPDGPGFFYDPTVLADIPPGAPAYSAELFGPVASLFRAGSIDEAIRIANDTPLGLGSSVWTTDKKERARLVSELEAGAVFINSMVASDPRLPFGGIKNSGYGRELGAHGIREFTNVKTVCAKDR